MLGFFSSPGLLSVLEAETQLESVQWLQRTNYVNKTIISTFNHASENPLNTRILFSMKDTYKLHIQILITKNMCVCVHACVSTSAVPRGFLAAVVVLVRVDAVERADVAVLLVAVAAVPFLVAAEEPV